MIALKSKAKKGDEKKTYDTKMAAKVRFSGVCILPEFVQRSLHSRVWHRFILAPYVYL